MLNPDWSIQISGGPAVSKDSPQLQRYSFPGIQTINVTKCPPNAAPQVRIDGCIYPKTTITLTSTLTLLLEIGSKSLDLKGHFMLDVKIERASN